MLLVSLSSFAETVDKEKEHIGVLAVPHSGIPVQLKKNEAIATKATFTPPVDILIVAKTDSTNLRIGYAADQVIFNWERSQQHLRVDGGPANGKHKAGRVDP